MSSPPQPRVRRERDRLDETDRQSQRERQVINDRPREGAGVGAARPASQQRKSTSASSTSSSSAVSAVSAASAAASAAAASASGLGGAAPGSRGSSGSGAGSLQASPVMVASPPQQPAAYYDYSEGTEQIARKPVNMAMHVPGQPPQPPHQHRLADPSSSSSSSRQRPTSGSASVNSPTQQPAGQFQHHHHHSSNPNNNNHPGEQRRPAGARDLLPSYNHATGPHPNTYNSHTMDAKATPRSPGDDLFPPNKVDIDAARYREAQQQAQAQARRNERSGSTRDRPTQTNTAKDSRDRRPAGHQQINGRIAVGAASPGGFHSQQRPISPDSLSSPNGLGPGTSIQRLPTPSVANSVLQPLDAKVAEYGSLMGEAQDEMARLDEEMRGLQERQRLAEQRFLEAKAKHDDYRRQYNDVEKALRGEYPAPAARKDRERGGEYTHNNHNGANNIDDDQQRVQPTPSMPDLQHYGQGGASGSGNLLNGNGGHPGMRSQRTVSIQSEYMDGDARPGSKRGRWSKLFGV